MEPQDDGSLSARVRRHIQSNVVGYVALFIALAGTSYALPRSSVTSREIGNRQVRTADLARKAVKSKNIARHAVRQANVANNTIGSLKVRDGTLTGTDIADGTIAGADVASNSLGGGQVNEEALDYNVLQRRLRGGCDDGKVLSSVDAAGNPNCVSAGGALSIPSTSDLTQDLLIKAGAVDTAKLADLAVTVAKIANDAVTAAKIATDAVTSGKIANDAVTAAKIATDAVTSAKVAPNTLTGGDIDESTLTGVVADTLDGLNSTDFLGATAAVTGPGDLTGNFPNPTIAGNAVTSAKVAADTLTGADIADTSSLGTAEINEGNLFNDDSLDSGDIANTSSLGTAEINESSLTVIQGAGQIVRGSSTVTSATGNPDVLADVPGFGTSDIEVDTCTPHATLPAATLRFNNTSGASVLVWEQDGLSLATHASIADTTVEVLGSALGALVDSDELLSVFLYRPGTGASARVLIAEDTDAVDCVFVVEAVTS